MKWITNLFGNALSALGGQFFDQKAKGYGVIGSGAELAGERFFGNQFGGMLDKVQGIPAPMTPTQRGVAEKEFFDAFAPGTTAVERLGAARSQQSGERTAERQLKEQRKMQREQFSHQQDLKAMEGETARDVARIQTGSQQLIAADQIGLGYDKLAVERRAVKVKENLAQIKGDVSAKEIEKMNADIAQTRQSTTQARTIFQERWPKLFSTMGFDNMMTTAVAALHGVPIEKMLKGVNLTEEQAANVQRFIRDAQILKDKGASALQAIGNLLSGEFGEGSKGRLRGDGPPTTPLPTARGTPASAPPHKTVTQQEGSQERIQWIKRWRQQFDK